MNEMFHGMPKTQYNIFAFRTICFLLVCIVTGFSIVVSEATTHAEPIVFLDFSHDSSQIHNRIGAFIVEHGYGYDVDFLYAETHPGMLAMRRGDAHIGMELWVDNFLDLWEDSIANDQLLDMGPNYPDALQGWYVPTYVIEGDPERGIEPMAPDLRSVADLPRYWELFQDSEDPTKGRFHNAPTGWEAYSINVDKLDAYGLSDTFTAFVPGSEAALNVSVATAYRRGLAWVGYHFEPSAIMGMYDMTKLEEPEYTEQCWDDDMMCAYPNSNVRVFASSTLQNIAPELIPFLEQYETTLDQANELLSYFENEAAQQPENVVPWFLTTYEQQWVQWVPADVAAKVKDAL